MNIDNFDAVAKLMAECFDYPWDHMPENGKQTLREYAEKVCDAAIKAEREECAKVCESLFDMDDDTCDEAEKCASAIRARK